MPVAFVMIPGLVAYYAALFLAAAGLLALAAGLAGLLASGWRPALRPPGAGLATGGMTLCLPVLLVWAADRAGTQGERLDLLALPLGAAFLVLAVVLGVATGRGIARSARARGAGVPSRTA